MNRTRRLFFDCRDEGALEKAYNEFEKWQKQYETLLTYENGFFNTHNWKFASKLDVKLPRIENSSPYDSLMDLDVVAPLYSRIESYEGAFSGVTDSYSNSEPNEDLSELSRQKHHRMVTVTKESFLKRARTKPTMKLAANPYLNFLRRLEESENGRIRSEEFLQEVSELSCKIFSASHNSEEKLKCDDGKISAVIAEEKSSFFC